MLSEICHRSRKNMVIKIIYQIQAYDYGTSHCDYRISIVIAINLEYKITVATIIYSPAYLFLSANTVSTKIPALSAITSFKKKQHKQQALTHAVIRICIGLIQLLQQILTFLYRTYAQLWEKDTNNANRRKIHST